jgi:hypothetical protein
VPVRIGGQIPVATQGQVLQVLKRTSVLESHGLKPIFVPFSYGGPQVGAAFAGDLDVFFSGDQPALNLIPDPHRTTVRSLLRDYVQARAGIVYAYGQPETLRLVQQRAGVLQELMWSHLISIVRGKV